MKRYITCSEYQYKGYLIQESDYDIFVRDSYGTIVGNFQTFDEAEEFINEETTK